MANLNNDLATQLTVPFQVATTGWDFDIKTMSTIDAEGVYEVPICVKRLHERATIPEYAHRSDSCFDIFAVEYTNIAPRSRGLVRIGLAFQAPTAWDFQFEDKSGLANQGIFVLGGVIDNGYTGEWKVIIANISDEEFVFAPEEKVCQVRINRRVRGLFMEVPVLAERDRGTGSLGSTGSTSVIGRKQ